MELQSTLTHALVKSYFAVQRLIYIYQYLTSSLNQSGQEHLAKPLPPSVMHANLQTLSTEIVENVAKNLQRPDLCCLRLVCKDLYNKSIWTFAQLLSLIKTDLSPQSLQKLVAMSNSVHLAPHIRTLEFRPDEEGYLGRGFEWNRHRSGSLVDPLAGAFGMLQDILRNKFINCRSFQIDSYHLKSAYDHEYVVRPKDNFWLTPGDVVSGVCFMVVNANLLVKSFAIESESSSSGQMSTKCLLSRCLNPRKQIQEEMSSWRSLNSLTLSFDLVIDQYDWVLNLLKNAPALRSLRLDLTRDDTFFPRLAALGPFHALESLSLESIALNGTTLSRFLSQHGNTLRSLTLRHLQLVPGDDNEEAGTPWETVFGDLIGQMDHLKQVSVLRLFETYNYNEAAPVLFPSLSKDDSYPVVPGSEERDVQLGVRTDARMVATLDKPVELRFEYYLPRQSVFGVAYEGRQMDEFWALLIKTNEGY